jgi:hypothetical protein
LFEVWNKFLWTTSSMAVSYHNNFSFYLGHNYMIYLSLAGIMCAFISILHEDSASSSNKSNLLKLAGILLTVIIRSCFFPFTLLFL